MMASESMMDETIILPTSYVQELLWLMDRASPMSSAYNVPRTRRLVGSLDTEALRRAFDALVARHEILRTTYAFHEDKPVQVIHPPRPVEFVVEDLRHLPVAARMPEAERIVRERARRPFDLTKDLLMRVAVLQTGDQEYVLHLDSHHIAFDGWSRDILFREVAALYTEHAGGPAAELPGLPIQFADYAIWEREHLAGDKLDQLLTYWRTQLSDAEFVLELPTDFPRPAVPGFGAVTERVTLPAELVTRIKALGQQHDATLYMTLLAAYATVLHRYTGQSDVLIGSPIAGRSRPETEGLIGYFANTIVQRGRFAGNPTFGALLSQIRESALGAYDHQDIPFEKLVLELQGGQHFSHSPLFQVVFTMLGGGEAAPSAPKLGDLDVLPFGNVDEATKFDLTLFMAEHAGEVTLTLRGRSDLFAASTMTRTLGHIRTVLEQAVEKPSQRVDEIPLLPPVERTELARWNATAVDVGAPATITQLVAAQAARVPSRVAVVSGNQRLTYAELESKANQLAHHLGNIGVRENAPVAIALDRSADLIVAILGVLKAGGAYVPVPPELPASRVAQQVGESGARVILATNAFHDRVPAGTTAVYLDRIDAELATYPATAPSIRVTTDALAYVLYTSGSTGTPKGVAVTHANIVHYTRAISRVLADIPATVSGDGFSALDGWHFGMVSTIGADLGNTALFPALCAGGTLHVLPSEVTTSATAYVSYATTHALDVLKITPSHLRALVSGLRPNELADVLPHRWAVLGGEALTWEFAEQLLTAQRCRVLNHYGPTETTVGVSTYEVTRNTSRTERIPVPQTVPIGAPLANTQLHVLSAHGEAQPVGIPGELYISGAGVTRGYLNRDALTAERFVTLPGIGRAYRSGDRVRRLDNGTVEFLGRGDDQVKVRGYRVELGEIEHALSAHPGVAESLVLVHKSETTDEPQVVAYVVLPSVGSGYAAAHAERPTAKALQEWVAERLPEYMVPSAVIEIDKIPLTATGKVDRKALPDPTGAVTVETDELVAPRTPTEEAIAAIWADVLKQERVGVTQNFITLGGHSLLAIRVLGKLSRQFGVRLPLRTLFDAPTVAQLAEVVELETKLAALDAMSSETAQ